MRRSLAIALATALLGLIATSPTSATAADVTFQTAVLQTASDGSTPASTSLLSTNVSDSTPVTPVRYGRYYGYRPYYAYRPYYRPYYAYRPYYRPYYAYRPYYRPYYAYRPYYRPYYRSYYAPYGGYYYGGPVYW